MFHHPLAHPLARAFAFLHPLIVFLEHCIWRATTITITRQATDQDSPLHSLVPAGCSDTQWSLPLQATACPTPPSTTVSAASPGCCAANACRPSRPHFFVAAADTAQRTRAHATHVVLPTTATTLASSAYLPSLHGLPGAVGPKHNGPFAPIARTTREIVSTQYTAHPARPRSLRWRRRPPDTTGRPLSDQSECSGFSADLPASLTARLTGQDLQGPITIAIGHCKHVDRHIRPTSIITHAPIR